ncbi:hypothetical protein [Streptomyces mirabilis]|uniref:hypothetical protein n=1 Tax=Streptomyces mirabilis TaxID=68239 RepID=UPI0036D0F347
MPIRTAHPQKGRWWGALVALLVALVLTPAAPAGFALAAGSGETGLRFEAPGTFVMYNADEGAKAENGAFVLPVAVVPGNTGPAPQHQGRVDILPLLLKERDSNPGGLRFTDARTAGGRCHPSGTG